MINVLLQTDLPHISQEQLVDKSLLKTDSSLKENKPNPMTSIKFFFPLGHTVNELIFKASGKRGAAGGPASPAKRGANNGSSSSSASVSDRAGTNKDSAKRFRNAAGKPIDSGKVSFVNLIQNYCKHS